MNESNHVVIVDEEPAAGVTRADDRVDSNPAEPRFGLTKHTVPIHVHRCVDGEFHLIDERLPSLTSDPDRNAVDYWHVGDQVDGVKRDVIHTQDREIEIEIEANKCRCELVAVRSKDGEAFGVTTGNDVAAGDDEVLADRKSRAKRRGTTPKANDPHDRVIDDLDIRTSDRLRDCLLYTSPSPRDGLLSRMPSSA